MVISEANEETGGRGKERGKVAASLVRSFVANLFPAAACFLLPDEQEKRRREDWRWVVVVPLLLLQEASLDYFILGQKETRGSGC